MIEREGDDPMKYPVEQIRDFCEKVWEMCKNNGGTTIIRKSQMQNSKKASVLVKGKSKKAN